MRSADEKARTKPRHSMRGLLRRWLHASQWWLVGGGALLAIVLGFVGFRSYLGAGTRTDWDFLYLSLQLFILESGDVTGPAPTSLEVARWLAPVVAAYTVTGLVASIFRDEVAGLRARYRRNHVIVCGLEAGWALTRMLRTRNERVVVIERDPAHPRIQTCRRQRIPVFVGDARDEQLLRKAGLRRARRLFTVCGSDGANMKVAEQARQLSAERRRVRVRPSRHPLQVLVHIGDPYLASLLTLQEIANPDPSEARIDFFSLYAGGARALLSRYPVANGTEGAIHHPHMVVVGLGRLGRQLVVQAARNWRAEEHSAYERLWITVADKDASERVAWLRQRHPFLDEGCELNAADLPPDPLRLLQTSVFGLPGCPPVSSVFVCLPDDAQGLGVGLALHRRLHDLDVPVVVRTYDTELTALLPGVHEYEGKGLCVFDLMDRTCRTDELFAGETEKLARGIHEAYVRQQRAARKAEGAHPSMVAWDNLPRVKKDSNRELARHIPVKLAAIGGEIGPLTDPSAELFAFSPAEVDLLARMEHERWMAAAPAGHPAHVHWDELSPAFKEIDCNFIRRMPALLASAGFQINRCTEQVTGAKDVTVRR
jgi:hypothetical protein